MEVELKEKGRIIIPAKIRRALDLHPGEKLQMEYSEGEIRLKRRRRVTAKDIRGIISVKVKLEEIEEALGRED